jgi:hypothetical protein
VSRPEPWLFSYGLLGFTQSGLVPVLMPLIAPHGTAAGITFAAFSLLGVFAPVLGAWADRTRRHGDLLIWGTMGADALLLLFEAASVPLRTLVSAGQVIGLVVVGLLAQRHPGDGFVFAGVALLAAGILALGSPAKLPPRPITGGDAGIAGPHHHGHHVSWRELAPYPSVINRPMRLFLLIRHDGYPAKMTGIRSRLVEPPLPPRLQWVLVWS